jgi:cytochrome c551
MNRFLSFFFAVALTLLFWSCEQDSKPGRFDHLDYRTKIRLRQYLNAGKKLYELHCANCHQIDGKGLAKLYPPLKGSDYLLANKQKVICGIRHGQKGPITVNGVEFNMEMPPIPNITDLEIAEIATYVYTEFADSVQIVTIHEIEQIMRSCLNDSTDVSAEKN